MQRCFIGLILLIVGFYILNYTTVKQTEGPALVCAAGFSLVLLAILQRVFHEYTFSINKVIFGLISLCIPVMMVWKASWNAWWILPAIVVGPIFIIKGISRREPAAS